MAQSQQAHANGNGNGHVPKLFRIQIADDHAVVRIRAILEMEQGHRDHLGDFDRRRDARAHSEISSGPAAARPDHARTERPGSGDAHPERIPRHAHHYFDHAFFGGGGARGAALRRAGLHAEIRRRHRFDQCRAARAHQPDFFTGCLAQKMIDSFIEDPRNQEQQPQSSREDCPLTDREIEILALLANGESNKKVATTIGEFRRGRWRATATTSCTR